MQTKNFIEYDDYKWFLDSKGYFVRRRTVFPKKQDKLYLHRHIWEKFRGKLNKGHGVGFIDKNRQNVSLENLKLNIRKVRVKKIYNGETFYYSKIAGYVKQVNKNRKTLVLSRIIYEDNFGKIPFGANVLFLDGNNKNVSPENLVLSNSKEGRELASKRRTGIKLKKTRVRTCKCCEKLFDCSDIKATLCSKKCRIKYAEKKCVKKECVVCNSVFLTRLKSQGKTCSMKCAQVLRIQTKKSIQKAI